jgi:hypothetical protein
MPQYQAVVGLDVGDRQSHYCVLDGVVAEGVVKTTEASLRVLFEGKGRMRIAVEAGAFTVDQSPVDRAGPRGVGGESAEAPADCGERCEA